MFCGKCGTKINQNDRFCHNCSWSNTAYLKNKTANRKVLKSKPGIYIFIGACCITILIFFYLSNINSSNAIVDNNQIGTLIIRNLPSSELIFTVYVSKNSIVSSTIIMDGQEIPAFGLNREEIATGSSTSSPIRLLDNEGRYWTGTGTFDLVLWAGRDSRHGEVYFTNGSSNIDYYDLR